MELGECVEAGGNMAAKRHVSCHLWNKVTRKHTLMQNLDIRFILLRFEIIRAGAMVSVKSSPAPFLQSADNKRLITKQFKSRILIETGLK